MLTSWPDIIEVILESEGGLTVDHAGITNYGITVAGSGLKAETIRNMNKDEAINWYTKQYWHKFKVLPPQHLHIGIDFAVNAGAWRATKELQSACNLFLAASIAEDGIIGPNTIKWSLNLRTGQYRQLRLDYYENLCEQNPEKYMKFRKGWLKRIARV